METPHVEGMKVRGLVGAGGCGRVYLAEDEDGSLVAVKVFESMCIQRSIFVKMTERLEAGGWPEGVLPVLSEDFNRRPALRITEWMADGEDADSTPRSLQHSISEHPGERSWPMVRGIAHALAEMHRRHVPHGNLKPGNVFLNETGEVRLTDWALGNMPGIGHFEFTDALLYQPPEQLLNPAGYLEESGFRWDVFAFGVLAFQLLTGRFPRCHETFVKVAPPPGETRREGMHADLPKIAGSLKSHAGYTWPHEPANALEEGFRAWIDRCLALDPTARPANLIEVEAGFERVEADVVAAAERETLLDLRRRADRRARHGAFAAGTAAAVAVVMAGLWQLSDSRLRSEKSERTAEREKLTMAADSALAARTEAEKLASEAKHTLDDERRVALARLEASRETGDRLFSWAMEKGHRRLPPLDGRELRLKRLASYFEDFIERTAEVPELSDERARAKLHLAEIALASGDVAAAARGLEEARAAWDGVETDAEWKFRMARNRLLLALMRQSAGDEDTAKSFAEARRELENVPQADVDSDRLNQLLAVLDFHEAKLLAAAGDDEKALEQLMRATRSLNRLADQRPDSVVLRSELAAGYLSSATILEGMGNLGDAREVRSLAAAELQKLLEEKPEDLSLRLELAGCYGAMAEAAVLSGDMSGADSFSAQAMKLLESVIREQPDHAEAVARLAAQLGLRAGLKRDRGRSDEALAEFDEGIRLLEHARASSPDNVSVAYRLALLWWKKGRMLGGAGDREREIELLSRARDVLVKMEDDRHPDGPPIEQLQRSCAYLLGDLGHARQLAGDNEAARKTFIDAVALWETLAKARPQSEEYQEGLSWVRQRVKELE